jgi:integrase
MYLRSGTYYFAEYGTNRWVNLGRGYVKAMAEYARLRGPDGPLITVSDLITRYLKEIAPAKAERTYRDNLKESKYLRAAFGEARPEEIKPRAIYAYLDARGRTSETRANREVALLSHMFTKAIRWGLVDTNPCKGVERFREKPRDRYIEDWEYLAFKDDAGQLIAAYMDFKLITGLRKGDVLRLMRSDLQDDGIHATVSKTGKRMIIEWSDALRLAVDRVRQIPRPVRGLHLFCTRHGKPYTVSGFSSIWQRKMAQALAKRVIQERFTDHDIRRKTGSDTDLEHATKLLGHTDAKVTARHYRVKPERVRPLR